MESLSQIAPIPGARVTVCIPTYARTEWLGGAIESVLGQSYERFVLVVGDDGTPGDAVREVVERYDDPRLRYVRSEETAGIVANFNRTLRLAPTEYVIQLGDDDELAPDLLRATVDALDRHPTAGLAHSRFDLIGQDGEVVAAGVDWTAGAREGLEPRGRFVAASMEHGCRVCSSTALLRRAALPPGDAFQQEDFPAFDFGCWLRMAAGWDVAFVERSLCRYRVHPRSYTSRHADITDVGYVQTPEALRTAHRVKRRFLAEHVPPGPRRLRLRLAADRALHQTLVYRVRHATLPERRPLPTLRGLIDAVRARPTVALEPAAWALLAGSLVGPRGVAALRRRS